MSPENSDSHENVIPLFGGEPFTPQERDKGEELTALATQAVGPNYARQLLGLCHGLNHETTKNIIASANALNNQGHQFEKIYRILKLQANRYRSHS